MWHSSTNMRLMMEEGFWLESTNIGTKNVYLMENIATQVLSTHH